MEEPSQGRLKLCLVSRYFPPMMGSGAPRIEDLSENLARMKQEIHVVTTVPPRAFPKTNERKEFLEKNRKVYRVRIPEGLPNIIYAILSTLGLFLKTLTVILMKKVDLVLATVPNEDSGLAGWLAAKITGRPFIFDVRDDWEIILIDESHGLERVLAKIVYYMFNALYRSAERVVCTSETLRRRISLRRGSSKGVYKITNGTKLETLPIETREGKGVLRREYGVQGVLAVFTGTLSSHQAPKNIVIGAKELRSRGVDTSIIIAGGGPLLNELRELSVNLGEPVRFIGSISRRRVAKLIAESDIGIITLRDSIACRSMIPIKFFDYITGSLPVVASVPIDSEIAQIIRDEQLGIVVKPEDPIMLADAIEEMTENKSLRRKISKKARKTAERYDWKRLSRDYLDLMFKVT
ncbi:MAG: glycosyltransferase family 4 protein [Candidatus Bathyarchaeota archaeon]|nr:MAG: glycosyltransferase family 4 protein [Candidatus Bathyarchaeota archaeon]